MVPAGFGDLSLAPWALSGRPLGAVNAEGVIVSSVLSDTCATGLPLPAAASPRSAGGAGAMLTTSTWSHPSLKPVPWTQGHGPVGAPSAPGIVRPARPVTLTSVRCDWCCPLGSRPPPWPPELPGRPQGKREKKQTTYRAPGFLPFGRQGWWCEGSGVRGLVKGSGPGRVLLGADRPRVFPLPCVYADSSLTACSGVESSTAAPQKLLILDARSYTAAVANRAKGGGCECEGIAVTPASAASLGVGPRGQPVHRRSQTNPAWDQDSAHWL